MDALGRRPRIVYITQDDLSKHSGYAFRVDRLRRAFEEACASVEIVGFASKEAVIEATVVRSAAAYGRAWALWQGLVKPADFAVITSIGAPYNGIYSLLLRLAGKCVIYDLHDPVLFSLPEAFGKGTMMSVALPFVALSEMLVDRSAIATIAASPSAIRLYKKQRWRGPMKLAYNVRAVLAGSRKTQDIRRRYGWEHATIVVYAGGLQRGVRGLEQQVAAVTGARSRGAPVVLLLVGFKMLGRHSGFFEELGEKLIHENALQMLGDVPPAELAGILQQCDVAVSSEPISYLMQSKYFDYLCYGVRVVAVDDGRDLADVFGELIDRYDGTTLGLTDYLAGQPRRMTEAQTMRAREITRALDTLADTACFEVLAG